MTRAELARLKEAHAYLSRACGVRAQAEIERLIRDAEREHAREDQHIEKEAA